MTRLYIGVLDVGTEKTEDQSGTGVVRNVVIENGDNQRTRLRDGGTD